MAFICAYLILFRDLFIISLFFVLCDQYCHLIGFILGLSGLWKNHVFFDIRSLQHPGYLLIIHLITHHHLIPTVSSKNLLQFESIQNYPQNCQLSFPSSNFPTLPLPTLPPNHPTSLPSLHPHAS